MSNNIFFAIYSTFSLRLETRKETIFFTIQSSILHYYLKGEIIAQMHYYNYRQGVKKTSHWRYFIKYSDCLFNIKEVSRMGRIPIPDESCYILSSLELSNKLALELLMMLTIISENLMAFLSDV